LDSAHGGDEMRLMSSIGYFLYVIFLFIPISVQSASLDEAVKLYQHGDFQNSYHALQKLSLENNSRAFFLLGKMYERGDGVDRDESKAIKFYQKAAALGLDEAALRIDQLRDGENSVVLDWYLESAWDGDVESVFNLGYLYESGMGVRIDESLALRWYEEAAAQQHADAQLRLGLMLVAGVGIDDDVNSGKQWILKAAANGNKVAQAIKALLIKNIKNLDIVKLVRGLRTLEHSNEAFMLQVLSSSVAQMSQPSSLKLLNESAALIDEEARKNHHLNLNRTVNEPVKKSTNHSPMVNPIQEESNVLFWVILSIVLTVIFTTLIHFLVQKRFGFFPRSNWEEGRQLTIPKLKIDANDSEFLKNLWGKDRRISLPDNFPMNTKPIEAEPIVFYDEENYSNSVSRNDFLPKNILTVDSRKGAQISSDDLVPKRILDLQMPFLPDSLEYLSAEKEVSQLDTEPSVELTARLIDLENEVKNMKSENQANSYIKQQSKEFEASRSNNLEEVSEARLNIGLMFLHGDGVVANIPLAIKWLKRSMEHGNTEAEIELKKLYTNYPQYFEDEHEEQRFSA